MAIKIKKYLKFFLIVTKLNYLKAMEYRINFWMGLLSPTMYTVGYLIYLKTLLSKTPSINGWSFDQLVFLFACGQLFYYTAWILYRAALETFAYSVRDGSLDFALKTPISARFNVSFREQRLNILISFGYTVALFLYGARNMTVNPVDLLLFFIFYCFGIFIFYNFVFSLISLTFWVIDSDELLWFGDDMVRYGSYPLSIYPGIFSLLLISVIPISLVIYVPATAFMGILDYRLGLLSFLMVFISWFVSQKIWHAGLRRYSSASS